MLAIGSFLVLSVAELGWTSVFFSFHSGVVSGLWSVAELSINMIMVDWGDA